MGVSVRSPELEGSILARVSGGESLRAICAGEGLPPESTVREWAARDPGGFGEALRAAREASAEHWDRQAETVLLDAASTREEIARARELSQVYRWRARVYAPRVYADKLDLNVTSMPIAEALAEARQRRLLIEGVAEPVPAALPTPAATEPA